jgi:chromosome segregation ATPase
LTRFVTDFEQKEIKKMDWNEELKRLENEQLEEKQAAKMETVSYEMKQLEDYNTEMNSLKEELDQSKQELIEVSVKNQPVINELNKELNILKADLRSRSVAASMSANSIEHRTLEMIESRTLRNSLKSNRYDGSYLNELEFAKYMSAEQDYDTAKEQLRLAKDERVELMKAFNELNSSDELKHLTDRVSELTNEILTAQRRVYEIGTRRTEANARRNVLQFRVEKKLKQAV